MRPLQGDGVEEAEGGDGLIESTPGGVLLEEMELVLSDVLLLEGIGGSLEVLGEAYHGGDVGGDGSGCVVAEAKVIGQALTEGCPKRLLE